MYHPICSLKVQEVESRVVVEMSLGEVTPGLGPQATDPRSHSSPSTRVPSAERQAPISHFLILEACPAGPSEPGAELGSGGVGLGVLFWFLVEDYLYSRQALRLGDGRVPEFLSGILRSSEQPLPSP